MNKIIPKKLISSVHQVIPPVKPPKCKDCKYAFQVDNDLVCNKFKRISVRTVEGRVYDYHIDTEACRDVFNLCGEYGIYFEKK